MQSTSLIFYVVLCVMLFVSLLHPWMSKDKAKIWSPITMVALTLIYYIVMPSLDELTDYGADKAPDQYLFYLSAVVFYASLLIGFRQTKDGNFARWNTYFTRENAQRAAILLFVVAMLCSVPFRGFRMSIIEDDTIVAERTGLVSYFIDLISMLAASCCLAFIGLKSKKGLSVKQRSVVYIILYFTLVIFIVCGFRYRLVILILALATTYHIFPSPRKISYVKLAIVGVIAYLGFAIMDQARNYGKGIDIEKAKSMSFEDASKGAHEDTDVLCFSIFVTDEYNRNGGYAGIEPIVNALCMPFPRALFPGKPEGTYMKEAAARAKAFGGPACLVMSEAFVSCGMFGVILYGLFWGWLCKKIWSNYRRNPKSIGAILLLAVFNGLCYKWVSRGYMAGTFNEFIYFVVMPFWITALFRKFINGSKKTQRI